MYVTRNLFLNMAVATRLQSPQNTTNHHVLYHEDTTVQDCGSNYSTSHKPHELLAVKEEPPEA
jgi:hypothetical protein